MYRYGQDDMLEQGDDIKQVTYGITDLEKVIKVCVFIWGRGLTSRGDKLKFLGLEA